MAVDLEHMNVGEDDGKGLFLQQLQGLLATAGDAYLIALPLEGATQELARDPIVVDNENPRGPLHGRARCSYPRAQFVLAKHCKSFVQATRRHGQIWPTQRRST